MVQGCLGERRMDGGRGGGVGEGRMDIPPVDFNVTLTSI